MLNSTATKWTVACVLALSGLATTVARDNPSIRSASGTSNQSGTATPESHLVEGFTEPYRDIQLAAAEMGTLSRIDVRDGDTVQAGQLLASLDDAVLLASLEVARAGMKAAGELQTAQTHLDLKKVELQKIVQLFERNHASQKELDRVKGEVRVATSRVQSVREDLEIRRLEYARIEAQITQRQIRSTIDGVVVEVRKDQGEFVSPSDPVVARVVQLDPLLVVFSVPANKRNQVLKGRTVSMEIGPQKARAQGLVEFVSPTADASTGTYRVKVRLPNPGGSWSGGEKSVLLFDSDGPSIVPAQKVAKRTR